MFDTFSSTALYVVVVVVAAAAVVAVVVYGDLSMGGGRSVLHFTFCLPAERSTFLQSLRAYAVRRRAPAH